MFYMRNGQAVNGIAATKDDVMNLEIFCLSQVVSRYTWALSALLCHFLPSHGSSDLFVQTSDHHSSLDV